MTKILLRRKAISLRNKGSTYSEIRKKVRVSKSTLSLWLKQYPLSECQLTRVVKKRYQAIEKFRVTMWLKQKKRLASYYLDVKKQLLPFTKKELFLAGLMLYWGEGNKASMHTISINNTDPQVIQFTLFWYLRGLGIKKSKIKVYLHLYKDMNIKQEITYWSNTLSIPKTQFIRPYIKNSKRSDIDQRGFGHGTCAIVTHNTVLKGKILMGMQCIADYYAQKVDNFDILNSLN
jgi:hypothetical protein